MPETRWNPIDDLSDVQRNQLDAFETLLQRFNDQMNMVSSDSAREARTHHLIHCLSMTLCDLPDGTDVVDWGTGGGLPAIPLAIAFPGVNVYGVDSVGKKVRAVRTIARRLGLENVFAWHGRAEEWTGSAHYSVSRATAPLADLWQWHSRVVDRYVPDLDDAALGSVSESQPASACTWRPGLICLKGGDLAGETQDLHEADPSAVVSQRALRPLLGDSHFTEKKLVTVTRRDA